MLKCDYRGQGSLASAKTTTLQKRRQAPFPIVTTPGSGSQNTLPEGLPAEIPEEIPEEILEDEPRISVSEPSLYVVTLVHIILSLSRDEVNGLPLQSPATRHLKVFDIRDRIASQINMHFPDLR